MRKAVADSQLPKDAVQSSSPAPESGTGPLVKLHDDFWNFSMGKVLVFDYVVHSGGTFLRIALAEELMKQDGPHKGDVS